MRLIDADAYAADLWKLRENYQMLDDTQTADKIMHGIFRAEQVLKEQPTVTASPWHRVEYGLPDKYTQCLVADADGKCAVGYYRYDCKAWDNPAFGWIEMENRIYIDDIPMGIGKVVAWMPIPPKEEEA